MVMIDHIVPLSRPASKRYNKSMTKASTPDNQPPTPVKRLYRSVQDRMIGGVAGGVAQYLGFDSSLMRLIFILIVLLPGIGVAAYLIAWIVIPEDPHQTKPAHQAGLDQRIEDWGKQVNEQFKSRKTPNPSARRIFGLVLVGIGAFFFLQPLLDLHLLSRLWPIILVLIGAAVIFGRSAKQ